MPITGKNIVGLESLAGGDQTVTAINPSTQKALSDKFHVATASEIEQALAKSEMAFSSYQQTSGEERARFLRAIADEIVALGDELLERASAESGLPLARFQGERGRTVNQLRLFADVLEEGSWVEANLEIGDAQRTPMPKPDIRKMLVALGPVVVFTASNFPLAFSTAGGDTASALAAGCSVIVKAHESHLGTNELVSMAIQTAARKTNMPDGVFSSLNGLGYDLGKTLVKDARVKAVTFTGSLRGGMAIHKLAQEREAPIPVFAEMGSINPVILLPEAVQSNHKLPATLVGAITMGVGQFCTNPGLLIAIKSPALEAFKDALQMEFSKAGVFTMLNESIYRNFENGKANALGQPGVKAECVVDGRADDWTGRPAIASVSASDFIANTNLQNEVFGPFSLVVECTDISQVTEVIKSLHGQLSGTIFSENNEVANYSSLVSELVGRVGRVILNQVPTGVEVGHAMQHGGPFPASSDSRFTSVGVDAIKRFVRPVAYQNWPNSLLPKALQDGNPLTIFRKTNGVFGSL
jgi:2,5-dioxopentanoate dehydrogenase